MKFYIKGLWKLVDYQEGESIYIPCDPSNRIYLIARGRVKLSRIDKNGRKLTLTILKEGDIFGEMSLIGEEHREVQAQALEDAAILMADKMSFLEFIRHNPRFSLEMIKVFIKRKKEIEDRLKDLVFKDLETRLSRTLLKLAEKHGNHIKVTHQELAELVGSTRESITLLLNRFTEQQIMDKKRHYIIIKNKKKLKQIGAVDPSKP
jgi:CRP/FNR family transcriptional regulator